MSTQVVPFQQCQLLSRRWQYTLGARIPTCNPSKAGASFPHNRGGHGTKFLFFLFLVSILKFQSEKSSQKFYLDQKLNKIVSKQSHPHSTIYSYYFLSTRTHGYHEVSRFELLLISFWSRLMTLSLQRKTSRWLSTKTHKYLQEKALQDSFQRTAKISARKL